MPVAKAIDEDEDLDMDMAAENDLVEEQGGLDSALDKVGRLRCGILSTCNPLD